MQRHRLPSSASRTSSSVGSGWFFAKSHPNPSEHEIRDALEGNLCRCTGYHNIVKAIGAGAKAMAAGSQ